MCRKPLERTLEVRVEIVASLVAQVQQGHDCHGALARVQATRRQTVRRDERKRSVVALHTVVRGRHGAVVNEAGTGLQRMRLKSTANIVADQAGADFRRAISSSRGLPARPPASATGKSQGQTPQLARLAGPGCK